MRIFMTMTAVAALIGAADAQGRNYPCSGSKGGVSHCEGERFVCNDGSYSRSQRNCAAEYGQSSTHTAQKPEPAPVNHAKKQLACKVVGVSDGDTLTATCEGVRDQVKVRLAEIDAPEKAQPWGARSKESLSTICFGKKAVLDVQTTDRYGREVARVSCDGTDANLTQVKTGMAWAYTQYMKDQAIKQAEDAARSEKVGLWVDAKPVPPWEFRRGAK